MRPGKAQTYLKTPRAFTAHNNKPLLSYVCVFPSAVTLIHALVTFQPLDSLKHYNLKFEH